MIKTIPLFSKGFPSGSVVKNLPANAGDSRDWHLIPGLGRSPGGGNGNPLQYSCLKIPMDKGAWWAIVHGVAKSQTRLRTEQAHMRLFSKPHLFIHSFILLFVRTCPVPGLTLGSGEHSQE